VFAEAVGAEEDLWAMEPVEGVAVEFLRDRRGVRRRKILCPSEAAGRNRGFEFAEEAVVEAEEMAVLSL
jgi:hypothetical protein